MTEIEFNEWLTFHCVAFPNVEQHFAAMPEAVDAAARGCWQKTLADVSQEDAARATEILHAQPITEQANLYPRQHAAAVREIAGGLAMKRNPPAPLPEPLQRATPAELDRAKLSCRESIRVATAVAAGREQLAAAGLQRQGPQQLRRQAAEVRDAVRGCKASDYAKPADYADAIIDAVAGVHRRQLADLEAGR